MPHRTVERRTARLRRASFGLCAILSLASASDAAGQPSAPEQRLREALGWSSFTPASPIAEPRTTGAAGGLAMMHVWLKSPPGQGRTELLGVHPLRRGRSVVAPVAAVGDTVTAFLGGRAMRVPVLARVAARQTFIGGVCVRTGWTYLLGAPDTTITELRRLLRGADGVALRRAAGARRVEASPPSIAQAYRPEMQRAHAAWLERTRGRATPEQLRDATQQSRLRILQFRGPNGSVLHYATFDLEVIDIPAGAVPEKSLYSRQIVSDDGTVLANLPGAERMVGTTDADGDGVDELVLENGLVTWDERVWRFRPVEADWGVERGCH
jgi:hypothetical protein